MKINKITSDKELKEVVDMANNAIKMIQDYSSSNPGVKNNRIKFPRGCIRLAETLRDRLLFIQDENLKSNLSYNMMLTDVIHWVISRTDLFGMSLEMLIKWQIAIIATICEAIIRYAAKENGIGKHGFCKNCIKLSEKGIITEELKNDLTWLWAIRDNVHIYEIDGSEYNKYTINDYNRAKKVSSNLNEALRLKTEQQS